MTKEEYQELLSELGIIYSIDYEEMTYNDCKVLLKSICKYIDEKVEKENESRKKDYETILKISKYVDDFVKKFGVLPSENSLYTRGFKKSFIKKHYGSYNDFCQSLGYENLKISRGYKNKYTVYDTFTNEIVMTGTFKEIHEKMFADKKEKSLRCSVFNKYKIKKRYIIEKENDTNERID